MNKASLAKSLRVALEKEGSLSLRWDCGCDQQSVSFDDWGADYWQAKHPYGSTLVDLKTHLIISLQLPGASPASDIGEGTIYLDDSDSRIKLVHTSTRIRYDDESVGSGFSDFQEYGAVVIEDLDIPDFSASIGASAPTVNYDEVRTRKNLVTQFELSKIRPDADKSRIVILENALVNILEPLLQSMENDPKTGVVRVDSIEASLEWGNDSKTLVYQIYPRLAAVGRISKGEIVNLFD